MVILAQHTNQPDSSSLYSARHCLQFNIYEVHFCLPVLIYFHYLRPSASVTLIVSCKEFLKEKPLQRRPAGGRQNGAALPFPAYSAWMEGLLQKEACPPHAPHDFARVASPWPPRRRGEEYLAP
jgi:hypothetical protein